MVLLQSILALRSRGRDEKWADEMKAQLGEDRFNQEIGVLVGIELQVRDGAGKIQTLTLWKSWKNYCLNDK